MKWILFFKYFIAVILAVIVFILVSYFFIFNESFYTSEFTKYGVRSSVSGADSINKNVLDFISGNSKEIPSVFNEREKSHLQDVRNVISGMKTILFFLFALLVVLALSCSSVLKFRALLMDFTARILMAAGVIAVVISGILILASSLDFGNTFENFHQILFSKGTYMFDPSTEIIVRLYPQNLFYDIGTIIFIYVIAVAAVIFFVGFFVSRKSKSKKSK